MFYSVFFCAGTLEWHFHEKKEDGKIFNENSCAKISGEFFRMYLVVFFNLKKNCFMPELEHHHRT